MSTLSLPTLRQKATSLISAICSGKDTELQAERDAICQGCDQFSERAVRTVTGKFKIEGHCKVCGCGARNIADIYKGKTAWKDMQCPRLKWPGDAEGKGISLHDANTLFAARDGLEYSIALLEHYAAKDKPLKGSAELIFRAHSTIGSDEVITAEAIQEVVSKLKFYHKAVQLYIDDARPLDPPLLAQVRGRPQQPKPTPAPPAPASKSCCTAKRNGTTRIPDTDRISAGQSTLATSQIENLAGAGV